MTTEEWDEIYPVITEQEYKTKFLGKKVIVIDSYGDEWVGICNFIGYNPYLPSYGFQVTIGRTPVTNVDPSKIEIWDKDRVARVRS